MGSRTLVTAALSISTLLLIAALSLWQATAPGNAQTLLRQGVASATEVDQLLAQDGDSIRDYARAAKTPVISVPGFAINIAVTKDEVLRNSNEQLANLLIQRSAALIYNEGLRAFDVTGDQEISLFSAQGLLNLLVGRLNAGTHHRAGQASIVLAFIWGIAAVVLAMKHDGFRRVRIVGQAVLMGALPGLVLSLGATFIAKRLGSADPFVSDVRALLQAAVEIPVRDYAVVSIAAASVMACGMVLGFIGRRLGRDGSAAAVGEDELGFDGEY